MVSIIITSYNKEKTIARAINSALNQSYKNCEVIVVDDCSTDKSLLICQKYGDKINIISNAINKGLPYSRQEGIRQAKGEFITFIDADDYLDSNAIEKCIKMQKINNADIVQMKISRKIGKVGLTIPFRSKYNTNKALDSCLYDESLFPMTSLRQPMIDMAFGFVPMFVVSFIVSCAIIAIVLGIKSIISKSKLLSMLILGK